MGGSGIESRWGGAFFRTYQTGRGTHLAYSTIGAGSLCRGYSGRGAALTTHPHQYPMLKKEHRYTSSALLGLHGLLWDELFTFLSLTDDQWLV